jgi:hypothetical protein
MEIAMIILVERSPCIRWGIMKWVSKERDGSIRLAQENVCWRYFNAAVVKKVFFKCQ